MLTDREDEGKERLSLGLGFVQLHDSAVIQRRGTMEKGRMWGENHELNFEHLNQRYL